jgi:RimJ/RimL family protein N-acetyltransferase
MPWVRHEPLSLAQRLTWVRTQRGHFDLDSDYTYGVFAKDGASCLGVALLKLSAEPNERELGYWIHAQHLRQGLATEVGRALVCVAFELDDVETLEIVVLPENEASRGVALKLGFEGPRVVPGAISFGDGELRDGHAYALTRVAYRAQQRCELSAFDALDEQLL